MGEMNGSSSSPPRSKSILFSIGSYKEETKKIKKIAPAELFSGPSSGPGPYRNVPRPVSMDVTDAPLFGSLQRPRSLAHFQNGVLEKPNCPPALRDDSEVGCLRWPDPTTGTLDKPAHPPQLYKRSVSLEPEQTGFVGKVALKIAAYEGDPRRPTRLDFLPTQPQQPQQQPQRVSRSSSRASEASGPQEDVDGQPIAARLQNELVATLERSNLRARHDSLKNGTVDRQEDMEIDAEESRKEIRTEAGIANGNVKKLASVLDKTLTLRQ